MNKVIYKLRPCDFWRIGELESWFTDMSAKGLHLKKTGAILTGFVKGEPKQMKYRIEVSSHKRIPLEQKQLYKESGWDHVTSYGNFSIFSSPAEINAPEIHTDPAEQSYTLKELDRKFVLSASIVAIAIALMIFMLSAVWFFDSAPTLAFIEGRTLQQAILVIVELYVVFTSLKAAISIRALRKRLSAGKSINHYAPWKKHQRIARVINTVLFIFVIFGSILPWIQLAVGKTETLPITSTDLPIVRLADIEQNSELVRKESYNADNVDWGNRYSYDWSILAPLQYQSDERGVVPDQMWQDGSGTYSPSIHTWVYQLSFKWMREEVINDLIERYGMQHRGGDFKEIENTDFDLLIVHEVDGFKEVFAAKDKAVMYVRYYGYADINRIIESIRKTIAIISN